MTPSERDSMAATVRNLWPRVKWGPGEWSVLDESAGRIHIDSEQAAAAIRNLKATSEKYPTVAAVLNALRRAENRPAIGPANPLPGARTLPEIDLIGGMTSFEWRVAQDPKFREYARKQDRLSDERESWIDAHAAQESPA